MYLHYFSGGGGLQQKADLNTRPDRHSVLELYHQLKDTCCTQLDLTE